MRVSFLIPAFNEAATIAQVLEQLGALDLDKQVIVIDDGSADDTAEIAESWGRQNSGLTVIRQPNRGKGRRCVPQFLS